MKNLIKLSAIVLLIVACSRLSESHLNDLKGDQNTTYDIIDKNNDGMHDMDCKCGYCEEGYNDSINEHAYYRLDTDYTTDTLFIYLVYNLTNDTVANLTNNSELKSIILKDNQ